MFGTTIWLFYPYNIRKYVIESFCTLAVGLVGCLSQITPPRSAQKKKTSPASARMFTYHVHPVFWVNPRVHLLHLQHVSRGYRHNCSSGLAFDLNLPCGDAAVPCEKWTAAAKESPHLSPRKDGCSTASRTILMPDPHTEPQVVLGPSPV